MSSKIKIYIDKLISDPKRLFLIDGLGALLTAFILFKILAGFEEVFGMPQKVIYLLSLVPFIYAIYSFCCYFFIRTRWRVYLKAIAIANILYCWLTTALVVYFYQSLTVLGLTYFLSEVIIIVSLVRKELIALFKL